MIGEFIVTGLVVGTLGAIIGTIVQMIEMGAKAMEQQDMWEWAANQPPPKPKFDGETFDPDKDEQRLNAQMARVYAAMRDGRWRTLDELAKITGDPTPSISARLRDLRKPRFGAHTIERENMGQGVWAYRMTKKAEAA